MDINKYTILIFCAGLSIGSIVTSLLHLYFFRKQMKQLNKTNKVQNDTIRNLLDMENSEQIPVKKIIGKNF